MGEVCLDEDKEVGGNSVFLCFYKVVQCNSRNKKVKMIRIPTLKQEDYANQGSTIGAPRVSPYASFYCCIHDFVHAYVNPYAHISPMFFLNF